MASFVTSADGPSAVPPAPPPAADAATVPLSRRDVFAPNCCIQDVCWMVQFGCVLLQQGGVCYPLKEYMVITRQLKANFTVT